MLGNTKIHMQSICKGGSLFESVNRVVEEFVNSEGCTCDCSSVSVFY